MERDKLIKEHLRVFGEDTDTMTNEQMEADLEKNQEFEKLELAFNAGREMTASKEKGVAWEFVYEEFIDYLKR